jgi:uncharacterized protein
VDLAGNSHLRRCWMSTTRHTRRTLLVVLVVAILVGAGSAYAQNGYPERIDPHVNDFAALLTDDHTASLRSLFSELKTDNGVEIVVVTIDSIRDYGTGDQSIEAFATNLFNTWSIGNGQKNDGGLILVAWKDREVRIEVGAGYGDTLNDDMQAIIDEQMIPAFRNEDYSQGIYDGARAISRRLIARADQAAPPRSAPARVESVEETSAAVQSGSDGTPLIIAGVVAVGGAASAFGAGQYARYRKRRCPNCQTYMTRLDEASDDVHLDSGQKAEELLNSVDYDVWKCSTCNYHTLHGYNRWLSGFGKCSRCNYRTLKTDSQTISQPTYTSTGTKLITRECRHCNYHAEERVTLPMLTRSTSSSSSYSGSRSSSSGRSGGRSSGGGASGKW